MADLSQDQTHFFGDDCDPPHEQSEYAELIDMIVNYGTAKYAQGCAFTDDTMFARMDQASQLLHDITVKLHRLYTSMGHDV